MRWRPRDPDLAVVLAFVAGHLVDRSVNPFGEGGVLANIAGALLMSVPFYWRRTRPYLMIALLIPGAILNDLIATPTDELFAALITLMFIGYVQGRHHEGHQRWGPFVLAMAGVGGAEVLWGAGDWFFVWLVMSGGLIGGVLLRRRALLTRELAERTHELEALRELRERDAVLDERRRIARELHDVVAHTVSVMVVQAGGARRQLRRDPQRALAAMDLIDETGRETLAELDRLFGLLQADDAAPSGLADLPGLVARTREAGLPVELDVFGEPAPLPAEADLAAYRLVQEALTNTLKHAGTEATARVEVGWRAEAVELAVTDTGHGLEGPRGEGSRRGLAGMRERMAQYGGDVEAGPRAGGGFEVRARLPIAAREEVPA